MKLLLQLQRLKARVRLTTPAASVTRGPCQRREKDNTPYVNIWSNLMDCIDDNALTCQFKAPYTQTIIHN